MVAEIAHIVAESRQGPRGNSPLTDAERNQYPNLILLCPHHHTIIDAQSLTYSVAVLRQMKADHETRIAQGGSAAFSSRPEQPNEARKIETIQSTLLAVTHVPAVVFAATCTTSDEYSEDIRQRIAYPKQRNQLVPFLVREGKLMAFQDLRQGENPFVAVTDRQSVEVLQASHLWNQAEGKRRYVALLNLALSRYASQWSIRYDRLHKRHYFAPEETGKARAVWYRSLTGRHMKRNVVWQPRKRTTGEARDFWWHLAAALRFHDMGGAHWSLSIRPERHLTEDGELPLAPQRIGRRVTRLKARMYNDKYLSEVHFWRDFLSCGQRRIILDFGTQSVVIESELLAFEVRWPGIPGDDKPYAHRAPQEDLFSWADFQRAISGEDDATEDEWLDEER